MKKYYVQVTFKKKNIGIKWKDSNNSFNKMLCMRQT